MLPCVHCGAETQLRVRGVPVCPKCDELEEAEREAAIIERNKPEENSKPSQVLGCE